LDLVVTHSFEFDPTYGYDEPAMREIGCPPPAPDFEQFWRSNFDRAITVAPRSEIRLLRRGRRFDLFEIDFNAWSPDGGPPFRLGGWLTIPTDVEPSIGLVVGHGYGGRAGPDLSPPIGGAAVIYPCLRGFNRSNRSDIPDIADRHVLHGIESRDRYIHLANAADIWAAVSALIEQAPTVAGRIGYAGESFGGGIGALAIPWDGRIGRAFLNFPSFGHHALRLTMPCAGSGEAVRRAGGAAHLPVLRYFDAATAASFTTKPVLVAAALFDPAVPPPGQFAVFNCLAGEKQLFVRQAAHFDWPGKAAEDANVAAVVRKWFGREFDSRGERDASRV
jgi:cephalosporin-C deacetylase